MAVPAGARARRRVQVWHSVAVWRSSCLYLLHMALVWLVPTSLASASCGYGHPGALAGGMSSRVTPSAHA